MDITKTILDFDVQQGQCFDIEFGHCSLTEFDVSTVITKDIRQLLIARGAHVTTSVLEDDKDNSCHTNVTLMLLHSPIKPSFIGYESQYGNIAQQLIESIKVVSKSPVKTKNDVTTFKSIGLMRDGAYSCPLLSAAWLACRLGCFPHPGSTQLTSKMGDKAIVVLPNRYKLVEKQALTILKGSFVKTLVHNVHHFYF